LGKFSLSERLGGKKAMKGGGKRVERGGGTRNETEKGEDARVSYI